MGEILCLSAEADISSEVWDTDPHCIVSKPNSSNALRVSYTAIFCMQCHGTYIPGACKPPKDR